MSNVTMKNKYVFIILKWGYGSMTALIRFLSALRIMYSHEDSPAVVDFYESSSRHDGGGCATPVTKLVDATQWHRTAAGWLVAHTPSTSWVRLLGEGRDRKHLN